MATVVLAEEVVRKLLGLRPSCSAVYLAVVVSMGKAEVLEVSTSEIGAMVNMDRECVRFALEVLCAADILYVERRPGRPMLVRLPAGNSRNLGGRTCGKIPQPPAGNSLNHLRENPATTCGKIPQPTPDLADLRENPPTPAGKSRNLDEVPSRACVVSLTNSTELVVDNGDLKGIKESPPTPQGEVLASSVSMPVSKSKRGHRLPEDWTLPKEWGRWAREWCTEHMIEVTNQQILDWADQFRDFWCASAQANAAKLDWQATWRNWARREAGDLARKQRGWQPPTPAPDEGPDADRARKRNEQAAQLRQERRDLVERFEGMGAAEQVAQYEALTDGQKMAVREVLKDEAWKQITSGLKQALRAGLAGSVGGAA